MKDDQRIQLTKRMLKEALLRLLKTKELNKIGVSELCKEAGINRATFYRHYYEPRDILNEIRHTIFRDVQQIEWKKDAESALADWLETTCHYFYENAEQLKVLFKNKSDEEFVAFLNEKCQEFIPELRKTGVAKALDDDSLRVGTYYYAGGIFYILRQWLCEPIDKTPEEIAGLIRYFLTGHN